MAAELAYHALRALSTALSDFAHFANCPLQLQNKNRIEDKSDLPGLSERLQ